MTENKYGRLHFHAATKHLHPAIHYEDDRHHYAIADCLIHEATPPEKANENAKRLVDCWNALAGIEHPDGVMKEAITALKWVIEWLGDEEMEDSEFCNVTFQKALKKCRAALAALGVKHE